MKKYFLHFFGLFGALFIIDSSYGLEHMDFPKTIADVSFKDRIENLAKGYEPFKDAKSYYQIRVKQTDKNTDCTKKEQSAIAHFGTGYREDGVCYLYTCNDGYEVSKDKKKCECPSATHEEKDGKCTIKSTGATPGSTVNPTPVIAPEEPTEPGETYSCVAGTYLKQNTKRCVACLQNYYCPGGEYEFSEYDQGLQECPVGYVSPSGSSSESDCDDIKTCLKNALSDPSIENKYINTQTSTPEGAVNMVYTYLQDKCDTYSTRPYSSIIRDMVQCTAEPCRTVWGTDDIINCVIDGRSGKFVFDDICD